MSSDISVWAKGLHFVEEKTGLDLDGDGMVGSEEPERPDDIKVTLTATLGGAGAAIPLRGVVSSARGLQTYDAPGGTFLGALPDELNVAVLEIHVAKSQEWYRLADVLNDSSTRWVKRKAVQLQRGPYVAIVPRGTVEGAHPNECAQSEPICTAHLNVIARIARRWPL